MSDEPKIVFRATIPDTSAALRFGGDEARVTFAVPACDVEKAALLIQAKQMRLKVTVELDESDVTEVMQNGSQNEEAETAPKGSRPWLQRNKAK